MSNLDTLISQATAGISPVHLDYSEELPNSTSIASQLSGQDALDVLAKIDSIAAARDEADASGEVNCDELDGYFREMQRYASLLPHLLARYPSQVLSGLQSEDRSTRLFVAISASKKPTRQAIPSLESALSVEKFPHIKRSIQEALVLCQAAKGSKKSLWAYLVGGKG